MGPTVIFEAAHGSIKRLCRDLESGGEAVRSLSSVLFNQKKQSRARTRDRQGENYERTRYSSQNDSTQCEFRTTVESAASVQRQNARTSSTGRVSYTHAANVLQGLVLQHSRTCPACRRATTMPSAALKDSRKVVG